MKDILTLQLCGVKSCSCWPGGQPLLRVKEARISDFRLLRIECANCGAFVEEEIPEELLNMTGLLAKLFMLIDTWNSMLTESSKSSNEVKELEEKLKHKEELLMTIEKQVAAQGQLLQTVAQNVSDIATAIKTLAAAPPGSTDLTPVLGAIAALDTKVSTVLADLDDPDDDQAAANAAAQAGAANPSSGS